MAPPPPGPRGERLGRLNYESWQADMFGFLTALAQRYGDVVGFDLGRSPCILVNGAPHVRELFFEREACLRKPEFVKDSNRGYWGDGLTTLEGSAWHAHRQALRSSFGVRSVSARLPVVVQCTTDMLDGWARDADVDLPNDLRILTARIAARVVLDAEVEGYGPGEGRSGVLPFAEAYGEDFASIPGGDPTGPLVMVRPRAPRRMDAVIRIIDERIGSAEERGDVLSDLIQARLPGGEKLTRDEIVGEIIQMLYAGHLTIPSSLVSFWRDIAAPANGEMGATIAAEADRLCAIGAPESPALLESYCLATLKESLRLHPPAPILYREVESAFELGGFEFARDVAVWVSPQLLHTDARYFPEPHRFRPERFIIGRFAAERFAGERSAEERSAQGRPAKGRLAVTPQSVYFPFGAGPRACVGSYLALLQMALVCLLTAHRFQLTPILEGSRGFRTRARNRLC
jgi:cytochrome P450